MSLISPNFDVKSIIFPNFGQGLFPKIAGKTLFVLANYSDPDLGYSSGSSFFAKVSIEGFQKNRNPFKCLKEKIFIYSINLCLTATFVEQNKIKSLFFSIYMLNRFFFIIIRGQASYSRERLGRSSLPNLAHFSIFSTDEVLMYRTLWRNLKFRRKLLH